MAERYCGPTSGPCRLSCVGSCATEKNTCRIWPYDTCCGSNVICTDSACPVSPVLTVSYSAVFFSPPAYPDITRRTPARCSNTPCTPQKQPPATTAVCSGPEAFTLSTEGAGI